MKSNYLPEILKHLHAPLNEVTPFGETQAAVDYTIRELQRNNITIIRFTTETSADTNTFSRQAAYFAAFYLATRGYCVYQFYTMLNDKKQDFVGYQVRRTPALTGSFSPLGDCDWSDKSIVCDEYLSTCQLDEQEGIYATPSVEPEKSAKRKRISKKK